MNDIQINLSTGDLKLDHQRDQTLKKIEDLCLLILQTISYPNSEDYDDDNTYLNTVNALVKQFVEQARGTFHFLGHDGYIKILEYCNHKTKSFNELKYDESL